MLHFNATFDHLSVSGRKEHISLKNNEINLQTTAKAKKLKSVDWWKSGIVYGAKAWTVREANEKKLLGNRNGFLEMISDNFQIGKENKYQSLKSVK